MADGMIARQMRAMADWTIARRIQVIAGMLMAALLLLAIVGTASTLRLAAIFADYRGSAAESLMLTDVSEDLFEAKIDELTYRTTRDPEQAAGLAGNIEEALDMVRQIAGLYEAHPEIMKSLTRIEQEAEIFRDDYAQLRQHKAERAAALERLDGLGDRIDGALAALALAAQQDGSDRLNTQAAAASLSLMSGRAWLERYVRTADEAHYDAAEAGLDRGLAELDTLRRAATNPGLRTLVDELQSTLTVYRTNAQLIQSSTRVRDAVIAELDASGPVMLNEVEASLDAVIALQKELGGSAVGTVRLTVIVMIAIAVAALGTSGVAARRIGQQISAAIGRSVDTMTTLADGDLEVEIEGADKENELGRMARALTVFRDNETAARAARAQRKEEDRKARERQEEQARHEAEAEAARQEQAEADRQEMISELTQSLGGVVDAAAAGDFSRRIDARFEEAALDGMAANINRLIENVESGVAEAARVMERLADGDLTDRMSGDFAGTFANLQRHVNHTIANLETLVRDIAGQCDGLGGQAGQMTENAEKLAQRAERQAASLEETSAVMEEISRSAQSSAANSASAAKSATAASDRVAEAGKVVGRAIEAMGDIRAASEKIGEIVSVIDGIAFQTNLLALNASVEAARAGAAGKGFAVVATEVRALAQRSGAASQDIKVLIDESAAQVGRGVSLVEETGTTLEQIVTSVSEMAEAMQELTTTAGEQATGVQEVTSAVTQLDEITQKNAALADQSRFTAGEVSAQAGQMQTLIGTFRIETGSTAARVVAAE